MVKAVKAPARPGHGVEAPPVPDVAESVVLLSDNDSVMLQTAEAFESDEAAAAVVDGPTEPTD